MSNSGIKKNFIYNMIYQVLSVMLPLVSAPYVTRVLGAESIGIYAYVQSIVIYFNLIAVVGSGLHGTRTVSANRDDKKNLTIKFWEIFLLRASTTMFALVIFFATICLWGTKYKVIFLIQGLDVLACMFDISWFFQGLEKFKKTVTRQIAVKILGVAAIFLFIRKPEDIFIYCLCYSIPTLLGNLGLWIGIKKYLAKISISQLRPLSHLKQEILLFIPSIALLLFTYVDKTMLGSLGSNIAENGYYEQSLKFVAIAMNVVMALATVMTPRFALFYKKNDVYSIKTYMQKGVTATVTISGMIFCLLYCVSVNLIPWFYGDGYEECIVLLQILSVILLFKGFSVFWANAVLIPTMQQNKYSIAIWSATGINIVLNAFLIPEYGARGASIASVVSEVILFILLKLFVKQYMSLKQFFLVIWRNCVAILVAVFVGKGISGILESGIVQTLLLSATILATYVCVLIVTKEKLVLDVFVRLKRNIDMKSFR